MKPSTALISVAWLCVSPSLAQGQAFRSRTVSHDVGDICIIATDGPATLLPVSPADWPVESLSDTQTAVATRPGKVTLFAIYPSAAGTPPRVDRITVTIGEGETPDDGGDDEEEQDDESEPEPEPEPDSVQAKVAAIVEELPPRAKSMAPKVGQAYASVEIGTPGGAWTGPSIRSATGEAIARAVADQAETWQPAIESINVLVQEWLDVEYRDPSEYRNMWAKIAEGLGHGAQRVSESLPKATNRATRSPAVLFDPRQYQRRNGRVYQKQCVQGRCRWVLVQ